MSVKFSFIFFFRNLIRRLTNLTRWWWFILAVHVPTAIIIICAVFIICPSFDESSIREPSPIDSEVDEDSLILLLGTCNTEAIDRGHAVVVACTVLDILTDALSRALSLPYFICSINLLFSSNINPSLPPLACPHQPPQEIHSRHRSLP